MPVRIDFVAGHHSWKIESQWLRPLGNAEAEAIPSKPAHAGIALRVPTAIGPKQGPGGIVERRIGPVSIVAGMKPPQSVKPGKRHAALVQVKDLNWLHKSGFERARLQPCRKSRKNTGL